MGTTKYFRNLFLWGAIWNIGAGIGCSLAGILFTEPFFTSFGMPVPPSLFSINCLAQRKHFLI